jgi:hypothetical protein
MKMGAERTSETSVDFYQTTRLNIPEGSKIYLRRCKNLVFHNTIVQNAAIMACIVPSVAVKTLTPLLRIRQIWGTCINLNIGYPLLLFA